MVRELLSSKNLWSFAHNEDPFVRRSIYSLLKSSLAQGLEANDWQIISHSLISQSLPISQLGSATEFSETLLQTSQVRPQLWTTDFKEKSSVSKRLRQYIKKGSQGASEAFWPNLTNLLKALPQEVIKGYGSKVEDISEFGTSQATNLMEDFLEGLSSKDEPRHNLKTGWASYVDTGIWLSTLIDEKSRGGFVQEHLTQIFDTYVNDQADARWALPQNSANDICNSAFLRLVNHGNIAELAFTWESITKNLLQAVKLSLPEQSKDFRSSQDGICSRATRYFNLEATVLSRLSSESNSISSLFQEQTLHLLEGSIQVLRDRSGKPYGAAAILEEAVRHVPQFIQNSSSLVDKLKTDIPQLLLTPSADRIISTILLCREWDGFDTVLDASLQQVADTKPGDSSAVALERLLSTVNFEQVQDISHFDFIVTNRTQSAIHGKKSEWSLVFSVMQNTTLPNEIIDKLVLVLLQGLSSDDENISETLSGLLSCSQNPKILQRFRKGTHGSSLVSKLLFLTESPVDEISQKAELLEKKMKDAVPVETTSESSVEILRHGIEDVGLESLS